MFYRQITAKDRVLVADTLKTPLFECPLNVVYLTSPFDSAYSINGDNDNTMFKNTINLMEENVLNAVKKRQEEILNNFQIETDNLLINLKNRFNEVHQQIDDLVHKIKDSKFNLALLSESITEAKNQVEKITSNTSEGASSNHESDINDEIRAIRQDPGKTFLNYLRSSGKPWEISQPVVFPVYINGFRINAVYDPFVGKSIVSQDLITDDDEVIDLNTEQVFCIPWRYRKMQSCYEAATVEFLIRNHKHTLKVSISPYWTRKVLLGLNFGVKFVESVKKSEQRIVLLDDCKNYFAVDYQLFEHASNDDASEAMST